ncbi:MAG: hypothetical protein U1F33_05345 [Alphaproteobacteria bacterium]
MRSFTIEKAGIDFRYALPSPRFHRSIGAWAGVPTDAGGNPVAPDVFSARQHEWLPTADDRAFVASLMHAVTEPGKMASWIAPPDRGINNLPVDYDYVRLAS